MSTPRTAEHERLVFECLDSLFATTREAPFSIQVTAVDNAPGSGLGARLRARFPGIAVIENAERRGFAENHNAALRGSLADFFVVANDDIQFQPGALARAVGYLMDPAHARVGVAAFRLVNPDGSLQPSTYGFPSIATALLGLSGLRGWIPFGRWPARLARWVGRGGGKSRFWAHDQTVPVDSFRLAVGLVRAAAAREAGMMSEVSRFGGEEAEWFARFRRGGWSVVFVHDAVVMHHGNSTVQANPRFDPEYLKGLVNYFEGHRAGWPVLAFRFLGSIMVSSRLAWYSLTGKRLMREVMADCLLVLLGRPRPMRAS
ncbi:MAG TPA: glycosyltransferase [Gemmatimonadales bacterium]